MMECIQAGREKKVTRTCNSLPCSQLEVVENELYFNSHITGEDISRVRKHRKLDQDLVHKNNNNTVEKPARKEFDDENPIDKLVLGKKDFLNSIVD